MKRHGCRTRLHTLTSLTLAALGIGASSTASPPSLFSPDTFDQSGRVTLTPGFSPDGRYMYFAQSDCTPIWECPQRLKVSTFDGHRWSTPRSVALPAEGRVDYPSVTPDGRTLLFSWSARQPRFDDLDVYENFDLWSLDLTDAAASPARLEGPDLNRIRAGRVRKLRFVHNETAPILTRGGDLYFWSERLDAIGERDIFLARADGRGGFEAPAPLPAPINSPARDDGAWINADGDLMLITYANRGGCGGNDLFVSHRVADRWSEPVNLGCEINSPYDEGAGVITPDGASIVFVSDRPAGDDAERTAKLWTVTLADQPELGRRLQAPGLDDMSPSPERP